MNPDFKTQPIICSPYFPPESHWELDEEGRFTGALSPGRRRSEYLIPIPTPKAPDGSGQADIQFGEIRDNPIINEIRNEVEKWRGGGAKPMLAMPPKN